MYYDYHRWYDPSIGRFISQDPLAGHMSNPQTLNPYVYVQDIPTSGVDPTGLEGGFGADNRCEKLHQCSTINGAQSLETAKDALIFAGVVTLGVVVCILACLEVAGALGLICTVDEPGCVGAVDTLSKDVLDIGSKDALDAGTKDVLTKGSTDALVKTGSDVTVSQSERGGLAVQNWIGRLGGADDTEVSVDGGLLGRGRIDVIKDGMYYELKNVQYISRSQSILTQLYKYVSAVGAENLQYVIYTARTPSAPFLRELVRLGVKYTILPYIPAP